MFLSKRLVYLFILGVSDLVLGADLPGQPFIRIPDTSRPDTLLKPLINNPLGSSSVEARESAPGILRGLLELRQSCQAGYGLCSNGGCCPLGGRCCSNGGCCKAGYWCYATGCCSVTETGCEGVGCCPTGAHCCQGGGCCSASDNCVITSAGIKGCCPIGSTCGGAPGRCSISTYVPCSNDDFCCAPGEVCYRDSSNTARCRSPSQNTTPPAVTTTPPAVATTPAATTRASSPAALSPSPVPSVPAGSGVPTPPAGSTSRVISVTDSSITWVGSSWVTDYNVPCNLNNTSPSKKTTADNHSLTFICSTSTAIYINMASYNVYYDVFWNGRLTSYTPSASVPNCTYVAVARGSTVGVSVNITIVVYGASLQSRQAETDPSWSFDINNFMIMEPTGQTTSHTGTVKPTNTAPAFNSAANRVEGSGIVSYVSYVLAALAWIVA